jgi:DNA-binding PucR family transcriptional regulator
MFKDTMVLMASRFEEMDRRTVDLRTVHSATTTHVEALQAQLSVETRVLEQAVAATSEELRRVNDTTSAARLDSYLQGVAEAKEAAWAAQRAAQEALQQVQHFGASITEGLHYADSFPDMACRVQVRLIALIRRLTYLAD